MLILGDLAHSYLLRSYFVTREIKMLIGDVAQLAEHRIPDPKAVGSSPAIFTRFCI